MGLHWDDDPSNNAPDNLYWGNHSNNQNDKVRNGNHHNANKTRCPHGHEYNQENTLIDSRGSRRCVTCVRTQGREGYHRRKS